jgi:peptidyl-prolyl cis-trans isomerase A (cyclophilin A)
MKPFVFASALLLAASAAFAQQADVTTTQTTTTQYASSPNAQPMGSVTTTVSTTTTMPATQAAVTPAAQVSSTETVVTQPAPAPTPPAPPVCTGCPRVKLKTSMGDMVVELDKHHAPKSTENFLHYVKNGHYNGVVFHRVIKGFMIQTGGYDKDYKQRPTDTTLEFEGKNGLKNDKYTLAMARPSDRNPNLASSQFFINVENNAGLNYPGRDGSGYAVFGRVVEGFDVVERIRTVAVEPRGEHQHAPVKTIMLTSATILK